MYRILIVEDDRGIAQGLGRLAGKWGLEARCVENFREVLSEFAAYDPHLVLLDIALPFFNGYYWCGEIRRVSKTPIVFISSAADRMNMVMAMNMGADDFIAKPFDEDVLIAKVQALLMERLWETDSFVDENTLTVNVNRLRRKLDAAGLSDFIATKFGVGYIVE